LGSAETKCGDTASKCEQDHIKRQADLSVVDHPLFRNITPSQLFFSHVKDVSNPVHKGDSGGPLFFKTKTGELLLVGVTSGSIHNVASAHSSILFHADLYNTVVASPEWKAGQRERKKP
jgi:Trypsin